MLHLKLRCDNFWEEMSSHNNHKNAGIMHSQSMEQTEHAIEFDEDDECISPFSYPTNHDARHITRKMFLGIKDKQ
jgi:hypothetical protein